MESFSYVICVKLSKMYIVQCGWLKLIYMIYEGFFYFKLRQLNYWAV
jgi:hypothetical protein